MLSVIVSHTNKVLPAHLRRIRDLMKFLDDEKTAAEVIWRGRSLGTWGNLRPAHRLDASGIRLVLQPQTGNLVLHVSAARLTARGAQILLSKSCGYPDSPMELIWRSDEADAGACISRNRLRELLMPRVRRLMPGCRIMSSSQRSDRANTLSGSYLRIHVRGLNRDGIILAANHGSSIGENYESAVSQALLWFSLLRRYKRASDKSKVHILVPPECSDLLQHRAGLLDPARIALDVCQYEPSENEGLSVRPAPPPAPPREGREFRWPVLGPFRWSASLARVLDLAPSYIRRYPRFQEYDSLRLWGLEFATARGEGRECIRFGLGPDKTELGEDNFESLRTLVEGILYYRRPDSPDPRHPYYRLQSERWLEALILEDVPHLFPELVPESIYPQIPVYLGKDPGRVDILGADREGTLVILELKVVPDPDLPIQALDYWGRVVRHNHEGDFRRRGYFSGIHVNREYPKIYLVSPVFSFHDSTEQMLKFFKSGVEVWKIGINEDWRSGAKILRRTRLRCGDQ